MVGGKYADILIYEVRCGYSGVVRTASGNELLTSPEVGVLATTANGDCGERCAGGSKAASVGGHWGLSRCVENGLKVRSRSA